MVGHRKHRRLWRGAILAAVLAFAVLISTLALWRFVESLGPLDVSVAENRSTVVLDRHGQLLRPFATQDGRWRLPAAGFSRRQDSTRLALVSRGLLRASARRTEHTRLTVATPARRRAYPTPS